MFLLLNATSHPGRRASPARGKCPASLCESSLVFPQCSAHLSWLLTDATSTTWVKVNVSSVIEKRRLGSLIKRLIAGFDLGESWPEAAAPASFEREPEASVSFMPLNVEIPVLRGFLTASEAPEWKQNICSTAGETHVGFSLFHQIAVTTMTSRRCYLMGAFERLPGQVVVALAQGHLNAAV